MHLPCYLLTILLANIGLGATEHEGGAGWSINMAVRSIPEITVHIISVLRA